MRAAIDLGVTQTKVCAGGKAGKFASLVAPVPAGSVKIPDGPQGVEVVYQDVAYYVGDRAAYDGDAANYPVHEQALDVLDDVRFCAALAMLRPQEPVHVVTGLPVFEYMALREKLAEHLHKQWSFRVNGREFLVDVSDVTVIPQGAGAYYAAVLNPDGSIANSARAASRILVLDIGGRTVNALTFEQSRFRGSRSFTIFRGMVHVYNQLRRALYREHAVDLTLYDIGGVLRNGSLRLGDTVVALEETIRKAADPVWQDIKDQVELELPAWRTYNEILLAGGGAEFFAARARALFAGVPVGILDCAGQGPDYANVRGYDAFGTLQSSRSNPVPSGS